MQRTQQGFTLIELVVVIVILGILAATALPKFVDLSGDARTAAIAGVAGALNSSASINYGAYKVNSSTRHAVEQHQCLHEYDPRPAVPGRQRPLRLQHQRHGQLLDGRRPVPWCRARSPTPTARPR